MSVRSLKRNYQTMGLRRRNAAADIDVRHAIMTELNEMETTKVCRNLTHWSSLYS